MDYKILELSGSFFLKGIFSHYLPIYTREDEVNLKLYDLLSAKPYLFYFSFNDNNHNISSIVLNYSNINSEEKVITACFQEFFARLSGNDEHAEWVRNVIAAISSDSLKQVLAS